VRNIGVINAQGVKANVLFFDKKPAAETPWTRKLWIYDLRTNMHFTLKTDPLKREDLDEFVKCYNPANLHDRKPTWYDENAPLPNPPRKRGEGIKGEVARLRLRRPDQPRQGQSGFFWLKDESLSDSDNLPAPEVIAAEIVEDLEAALEQFREILADMGPEVSAENAGA